ncbi:MAG TPA: hypothetical protein VN228_05205 [Pyrinomonadaceae bacterium]|nr:hypothetical protein [Pyrinomonadaceae bacterium]
MPAERGQTFVNGKIFTARGEEDFAGALKVAGGRFTWVELKRKRAVVRLNARISFRKKRRNR